MKSPALQFITHAWDSIPHSSWQRLNSGMYSALSNAVGSGMKFAPNDLKTIANDFRSHYWMGDGEGLYAAACGGKRGDYNLSAAIAFETKWGRKPWLWSEDSKTPKRLHVGERFTWQGHFVTITSFDDAKQSITACTYKERDDDVEYHDGKCRRLVSERLDKKKFLTQRWSPEITERTRETSKIAKRFTITFEELQTVRKAAEAKVRKYLKMMEAAQDVDALALVWPKIQREGRDGFRHFDIETLRSAYGARHEAIREAIRQTEDAKRRAEQEKIWKERERKLAETHDADLERWLAGEDVGRYFGVVRLRIKNDYVETSTNQRATVSGARKALRFIRKHRACGWEANGEQQLLDEQFPIKAITDKDVIVGCTTVPMSEVERIGKLLLKPV